MKTESEIKRKLLAIAIEEKVKLDKTVSDIGKWTKMEVEDYDKVLEYTMSIINVAKSVALDWVLGGEENPISEELVVAATVTSFFDTSRWPDDNPYTKLVDGYDLEDWK